MTFLYILTAFFGITTQIKMLHNYMDRCRIRLYTGILHSKIDFNVYNVKYKVLTTTQGVLYGYDSQDYLGYIEKYK